MHGSISNVSEVELGCGAPHRGCGGAARSGPCEIEQTLSQADSCDSARERVQDRAGKGRLCRQHLKREWRLRRTLEHGMRLGLQLG